MRRRSIKVLAAALLLLGAGAAAVHAYDSSREDLVADGVTVGGVDVGGLRGDEARTVLSKRIAAPLRRPLAVRRGGVELVLRPSQIGTEADVNAMVHDALRRSREGNPLGRTLRGVTGGRIEAPLEPRISFDRPALRGFIRRAKSRLDRPARDATVRASGSGLTTVRHRVGEVVPARTLEQRLAQALRRPQGARTVEAPIAVSNPKIRTGELADRYPYFITVDRSAFRLHFYKRLRRVKSYVIAVGRIGFDTPEGLYHIQNKAADPAWSVPNRPWAGSLAGRVIPPGPDNPIKSRWMGIYDGAGVHGTDDTASLGTAASHGCIRMSIPEVKELYDQVPRRTPIYIG